MLSLELEPISESCTLRTSDFTAHAHEGIALQEDAPSTASSLEEHVLPSLLASLRMRGLSSARAHLHLYDQEMLVNGRRTRVHTAHLVVLRGQGHLSAALNKGALHAALRAAGHDVVAVDVGDWSDFWTETSGVRVSVTIAAPAVTRAA